MGGTVTATKLHEAFSFGITDPTDPAFAGDDGAFNPALAPFDLTNGGSAAARMTSPLRSNSKPPTFRTKSRRDRRRSSSACASTTTTAWLSSTQVQPRLGVSYAVPHSGTLLRASYGRTMETPYNENLLLSGGYGLNGLFGTSNFVPVGTRNEVEIGHPASLRSTGSSPTSGYFNKHTDNAYDFGVLFDTPIAFPVAWDHSTLNGVHGPC